MQAIFRNQVDRTPEEPLQILPQREIRHSEIIAGKPGVEQIDIGLGRTGHCRRRVTDRRYELRFGWLRIRVGDYRIVYEVRDSELVVLVIQIGHRSQVYDR